jgi:hypothetical protein
VSPNDVGGVDRRTMKADSTTVPAGRAGHVHIALGAGCQRPQVSRRGVARDCARAAGQNRSHLPVKLEGGGVANAVHAPVHPVQVSAIDPSLKRSGAHASGQGLPPRDVALLALGK